MASGEHVKHGKKGHKEKKSPTSGITSSLLVTSSTGANAKGIAAQVVQPVAVPLLVRRRDALIQPLGICQGWWEAKSTMGQCHFARHVCAKLQSANQVLDDLTAFMHFLAITVDVGSVG